MPKGKDKKLLGIVVPIEIYEKLEKMAKDECRSVSNLSYMLIMQGLKQEEGKRD